MKHQNLNIFAAWFFMLQTLAMGWVAAAGNALLEILGAPTPEGSVAGRIVGALLLLLIIYVAWHFMRGLPPHGKPEGNGYRLGRRVLLAGNVLACLLFVFQLFESGIEGHNTHLVLDTFTTAFGYFAMGCFAIGFSLLYQSSLPQEKKS
jgi:hypothetical protein